MAQLFDTQTQQPVEVAEKDVQAAVQSGRYLPQKGRVELVNEAGERANVDANEASQAFASGWSYFDSAAKAEEERREKFQGRAVEAGLAGAARGLTLGLSDKALTATGAVESETLRGLQDYNETASTVGEVAGALVPALVPGGQVTLAGAATRAAASAGKKLATSVVGRAMVSGAVEGALFGAGNLVSEEALGRPEVNAQKAVATIGLGALLGGAGGALFGAAESKLARALGGEAEDAADAGARASMDDGLRESFGPRSTTDDMAAAAAESRASPGAIRGATDAVEPPARGLPDAVDAGPPAAPSAAPDVTTPPASADVGGAQPYTLSNGDGTSMSFRPVTPDAPRTGPTAAQDFNAAMGDVAGAPGAGARNPVREGAPSPFSEPPVTPPGGAAPPAGGGGGSRPPGDDGFPDLEDSFNRAFAGADSKAASLRKFAEATAQKESGTIRKIYEAMGLDFPDAETWVLRGLDVKKAARKRLREKGLDKVAPRELLEDVRFREASKSPEGVINLLTRKKEEAGDIIRKATEAFDARSTPADWLNVDDFVARAKRELVDDLLDGTVAEEAAGRRLARELKKVESFAKKKRGGMSPEGEPLRLKFSEAEDFKRRLDKALKWDSTTPNEVRDQLRQLRGMLNGAQEERVAAMSKRLGEDVLEPWKRAKTSYGRMAELEGIALERLKDAKDSNRNVSLTDYLSGLAAFAAGGGPSPVGLAMGAGAALLNKWGRERLPFLLAIQLHKLDSGGGAVKGAARALRTFVQATDKKASEAGAAGAAAMQAAEKAHPFGSFAETLRRAAALGERELWAVHSTLSDSPEYRAAMSRAGLDFSQGAESAGKAKAETLGTLEKASQSFDARAEASAQNFVEGRRSARKPTAPTAETRKAAEDAQRLAQRPDIVTERVTQSLSKVGRWAPGTFAAAVSTAQRGVAYLAQTAPKPPPPPGGVDLPALRRPWAPTGQELSAFARRVETVRDPVSVLEAMASGTVTREHVETLREVYPELHAELRGKVLERVASRTAPVTYQQRLALGFLLGEPLDSSATPQAVAFYQAQFAEKPTAPPPGPSGARTSKRLAAEYPESLRLQARRA